MQFRQAHNYVVVKRVDSTFQITNNIKHLRSFPLADTIGIALVEPCNDRVALT